LFPVNASNKPIDKAGYLSVMLTGKNKEYASLKSGKSASVANHPFAYFFLIKKINISFIYNYFVLLQRYPKYNLLLQVYVRGRT
jgi:hypothetical protein